MKRVGTVLIGVLLGLVLLGLVLSGVDIQRVRAAFAEADYRYIVPALGLLILGNLTRAVRWRVLLQGRLPLDRAFSVLNISYLFNGALPFRLGEVARIFIAGHGTDPVPYATTLSTVVVERLLDLLAVLVMLGGVLIVLPLPGYVTAAGITLGAAALAAGVLLSLVARGPKWVFSLLVVAERVFPLLKRWQLHGMLERFLEGLSPLSSMRGVVLSVIWTAISWGLSVVAGYILLYAFYPQPTWSATFLFIVMASLAVSVPYVPGAVGPYEAGVVMALNHTGFGQPEGAAVAFAVILHATNLSVYVGLGLLGLLREGITLGQVARGAREIDATSLSSM